jgi:hypothetical protein
MDISGDAAERIVRISMDGAVETLKLSGEGVKLLAAAVAQAVREENKTSGLMQLRNMLKSGKELRVFILSQDQFESFRGEVKRFGVTYCVLRDKNGGPDSPVEVMVKADDSSKIQRIFERLKFAEVSTEDIEAEIEKSLSDTAQAVPELAETADIGEKPNEAAMKKEVGQQQMPPFTMQDSPSHQSEHISEGQRGEGRVMTRNDERESVRVKIIEMRDQRQGKPEANPDRTLRGPLPIEMKNPARNAKNWNKESR